MPHLRKWSAIGFLCLAGCGQTPVVTPSAAFVFVGADEPAAQPMTVQLLSSDGEAIEVLNVMPGEKIIAQHASSAGNYTLQAPPTGCSIDVTLIAGSETDVAFMESAVSDCFELLGTHVAGDAPHPFFGALSLALTGAEPTLPVVELISLEQPPNPGRGVLAAPDEPGTYFAPDLPPGRYEVLVRDGGRLLASEVFEIGIGAQASVDLVIDLSDRN